MVILSLVFWGTSGQNSINHNTGNDKPEGIHISGNDATQPNQVSSAIPVMTMRPGMIPVLVVSSMVIHIKPIAPLDSRCPGKNFRNSVLEVRGIRKVIGRGASPVWVLGRARAFNPGEGP